MSENEFNPPVFVKTSGVRDPYPQSDKAGLLPPQVTTHMAYNQALENAAEVIESISITGNYDFLVGVIATKRLAAASVRALKVKV